MFRSFMIIIIAIASVLLACNSSIDVDPAGHDQQAIIGGTPTTGDPAIVALYARVPGADSGSLCTGTIVSPTVVLTAAHCVEPDLVGAGAEFTVWMGSDLTDGNDRCPCLSVAEVHADPLFDANLLTNGHDIAVAILEEPVLDVEPIPYMRDALTDAMSGGPVRIVGYGLNDGFGQKGAGIKREADLVLNSYDDKFVKTGVWGKGICNGDSGGPVLMEINGQETVIGVNSFGFIYCMFQASSTRVDTYKAFVDSYVDQPPPPPPPPPPTCTEGETRCEGDIVLACQDGLWVDLTDCAAAGEICADGTCVTVPPLPDDPGADPGATGTCSFNAVETSANGVPVTAYIPQGQPGPYPSVIINPGYTLDRGLYATTAEHLASWCYLAVLNGSTRHGNHPNYAADVVTIAEWLEQGGEFEGAVDTERAAVMGHSLGGKVGMLAAAQNPGLFQAVIGLDPVDANEPSVTPELMGNIEDPVLLLGETFSGENGFFGIMCAPVEENYQQYYDHLPAAVPALEITFHQAYHQSWLDNQSCGLACFFCTANPNADHDLVRGLSRRYATAWLEFQLRGRTEVEPYLWGTQMQADVDSGAVSYRHQ